MSDPVRIIVADDHPLFLEGVVAALHTEPDFHVVGQATDAEGALRLAREHVPDLAMLDISMPGSGLHAVSDIAAACPATKIAMLTVSADEDDLFNALQGGASGYILKGVSSRDLVLAIRAILNGEIYVTPELAGRLLREMSRPISAGPLDELSPREREVLGLVATGLSNQEVGQQLGLAEKTIKHYMTNILAKLQVRSRVEAALLAQKHGVHQP